MEQWDEIFHYLDVTISHTRAASCRNRLLCWQEVTIGRHRLKLCFISGACFNNTFGTNIIWSESRKNLQKFPLLGTMNVGTKKCINYKMCIGFHDIIRHKIRITCLVIDRLVVPLITEWKFEKLWNEWVVRFHLFKIGNQCRCPIRSDCRTTFPTKPNLNPIQSDPKRLLLLRIRLDRIRISFAHL